MTQVELNETTTQEKENQQTLKQTKSVEETVEIVTETTEQAADQPTEQTQQKTADELVKQGKLALTSLDYNQAQDCLSRALEIM